MLKLLRFYSNSNLIRFNVIEPYWSVKITIWDYVQVNREKETCSSAKTFFLGDVTSSTAISQSDRSFVHMSAFISNGRIRPID